MKLDPDFLFFDDPLTWRRTINSEEFNTDMPVSDVTTYSNSLFCFCEKKSSEMT